MAGAGSVWWDVIATPLGPFFAAQTVRGVWRSELTDSAEAFLAGPGMAGAQQDPEKLAPVMAWVAAYFAGQGRPFDLPLDLADGTPFQQEVWQAVLAVPAGQVRTYGELARQLGRPRAARAVGAANAHNPLALIVPCHRLVGADGSLRGYGSGDGLPTKRWLLDFEGAL